MNPPWLEAGLGSWDGFRRSGWRSAGIRVLAYHGVVENKKDDLLERNFVTLQEFQSHLHFLRRHRVLSLAELADEIRAGVPITRPTIVITFDDGHANNSLAGEILAKFRMPWSLFVPTAAIGRENSIWTTELSLLLLYGKGTQLDILDENWSLKERRERESSYQVIRRVLKVIPSSPRKAAMDSIRQQFPMGETQRLLKEFPSMQMFSWAELGLLLNEKVEIGSHGVNHEIHHAAQSADVRFSEMTESKAELEKRLNVPCDFFVFPNGDFNPDSADEVRAAGYKLGFTTEPEVLKTGANPYLLPRIEPAGSLRKFAGQFWGR
jgi:peptidoglycan/xylan/chitin deacetylase (PgdA/CDA1 family)